MFVLVLEIGTGSGHQGRPIDIRRDYRTTVEQSILLVGHLQEQQVGELLHVVAVRQTVVAQNATEVPQALYENVSIRSQSRHLFVSSKGK